MMDDREKRNMRNVAISIVARLQQCGYTTFFAGGCVRDALRGVSPKDIDIVTAAEPEVVQGLFPRTIPVGVQFGVVRVVEQGFDFEVATFRADGKYIDGRRPESVVFSTPREDAERRDFTVNGMFLDPITGQVIDYVGGQEDLARQLIRAIGRPAERFQTPAELAAALEPFAVSGPTPWAPPPTAVPYVDGHPTPTDECAVGGPLNVLDGVSSDDLAGMAQTLGNDRSPTPLTPPEPLSGLRALSPDQARAENQRVKMAVVGAVAIVGGLLAGVITLGLLFAH